MTRVGRYPNPYLSFELEGDPPSGAQCTLLSLVTEDRAASHAALWTPATGQPRTAVMLMHPRADFLRHYAVPRLLDAGYAVLAQNSRWVGNDSMLVHEHVLLDVAAGVRRLRALGFERIVALGNSGGGSLYGFYAAQAAAAPGARLKDTAAGDRFDLGRFEMPPFDALVLLAAHPGEGLFLLHTIDASVTNESDPVGCDPALDIYDRRNGFRPPPEPSQFDETFLALVRTAQRDRVERIDTMAREMVAARRTARRRAETATDGEDATEMRRAVAVPFFTVYRTEADPRYVDLSLDRSARDYGSLFSRRPDVVNYGPFGFARVVTPEAWLSTWSGLTSRASLPANGPAITLPALVVSYDGDNAVFASDARANFDALGSDDKTAVTVAGDHYGHVPAEARVGVPSARELGRDGALGRIVDWLRARDF